MFAKNLAFVLEISRKEEKKYTANKRQMHVMPFYHGYNRKNGFLPYGFLIPIKELKLLCSNPLPVPVVLRW